MEHPSRVGKYEVEKFLGGGMSRVYRAKDSVLGRSVALKILAGENAADPEAKARFLQEARLASTTAHENIIAVYDFGEDQGRPFMVMELLEGESLRDAIQGHRAGDIARKLRIALQVARAIGHIHSKKIVHRDIKPENIHLDPVGRAKLMDFGIAMDKGIAQTEGTQAAPAGLTQGTPFYMSPEQVLGQDATTQADVYSFGVLAYELFTGIKPIQGATVEQLFDRILHQAPDLEPLHEALVPPAAIDLIAKCLAKEAADRPRGFEIICAALEEILGPGAIRLKPLPEPAPAAPLFANSTHVSGWSGKLSALLRTEGGVMLLSGLATLAVIVLLYVLFGSRL
jgi:serine/threonine protein kinase